VSRVTAKYCGHRGTGESIFGFGVEFEGFVEDG
jgi:hypothetical protein